MKYTVDEIIDLRLQVARILAYQKALSYDVFVPYDGMVQEAVKSAFVEQHLRTYLQNETTLDELKEKADQLCDQLTARALT